MGHFVWYAEAFTWSPEGEGIEIIYGRHFNGKQIVKKYSAEIK